MGRCKRCTEVARYCWCKHGARHAGTGSGGAAVQRRFIIFSDLLLTPELRHRPSYSPSPQLYLCRGLISLFNSESSTEHMPSESRTGAASIPELKHLSTSEESNGVKQKAAPQIFGTNGVLGHMNPEDGLHPNVELGPGATLSSYLAQPPMGLPQKKTLGLISSNMKAKDFGAFISLGGPTCSSQPFHAMSVEGKELGSTSSALQKVPPSCNIFPKPVKSSFSTGFHSNLSIIPHMRIARPPVEGRGRNQLLPRYWPRITEQELQQISGDPNCTIVPLFEKVLSASDAGRIGRLVLPKACAEDRSGSMAPGAIANIIDIVGNALVYKADCPMNVSTAKLHGICVLRGFN